MKEHKMGAFRKVEDNLISRIAAPEMRGYELLETVLKHPNIQQLLTSQQTFDAVILEQFASDALKGFCHHFNAPCIAFSPTELPHYTHAQIANPDHPAYCLGHYCIPSNAMHFFQRLANSLIYLALKIFTHARALPKQNQLMLKYFPQGPQLYDSYYNVSLILINTHVSINPSIPRLPKMVEIGGFHINSPKKLPKNLENFIDDAKNGVILLSLGSHLRSKDLPLKKRSTMFKVFAKLEQRIVWKLDDDPLNWSTNVKIVKWLPQQDVLAHPNVKLFITHGGLLSIIEAVYYGVPILGIPIFGDQPNNVVRAEENGYAIHLPLNEITEDTFNESISTLLYNPLYRENVKVRSKIMHDQPMKPLDRAIFWIEYIIRHRGAPDLRSAALELTWYQYLLIDVVFMIIFVVTISLCISYKINKTILKIAFRKTTNRNEAKKLQ